MSSKLKRTLGFLALSLYGAGDILGAGIYALVGEVSAEAGAWNWASFLVAMTIAGLTALAYCELVTRFPQSGGEATFALRAFRRPWLGALVGWLVFCSGVISMSAVAHACANYVQGLYPTVPESAVWLVFLAAIAGVNFWGIRQSSVTNIVFTLLEASGLIVVIVIGAALLLPGDAVLPVAATTPLEESGAGVMRGAAVAFFAYIGFQDMVNVAEEVKDPGRVFPRALLTAVVICGVIYLCVSLASMAVLSPGELAAADAPLLAVVQKGAPWLPEEGYTLMALVAVANTGLLNSITASRLLFGMSKHGLLPKFLSRIHPKTHTPHFSVLTIFCVGVLLAFSGTLGHLAGTTSFLLLVVFTVVNASLIWLRKTSSSRSPGFSIPLAIPAVAVVTNITLLAFVEPNSFQLGTALLIIGALLAALAARRGLSWNAEEEEEARASAVSGCQDCRNLDKHGDDREKGRRDHVQ